MSPSRWFRLLLSALHSAVEEMAHAETFHGYAPDLGYEFLRNAIAKNDYQDTWLRYCSG